MNIIAQQCPQCGFPELPILQSQGHCQCPSCGAKFVVDWPAPQSPQLSAFEALIRRAMTNTQFLAADRRLSYIREEIAQAQEGVDARQREVAEAMASAGALEAECGGRLQSTARKLWAVVALATMAWLLVAFVLENAEWYGCLFFAVAISAVALRLRFERKKAARSMEITRLAAHHRVERANTRVNEALMRQKDLLLEQELCRLRTERYRYTDDDTSQVDAAVSSRNHDLHTPLSSAGLT